MGPTTSRSRPLYTSSSTTEIETTLRITTPRVPLVVQNNTHCGRLDVTLPYFHGANISCVGSAIGETCTLSCRDGLKMYGGNVLVCSAEGVWLGACGFACSNGSMYGNTLYRYHSQRRNFSNADAYCRRRGGALASVMSRDENLFIFGLHPVMMQQRWLGATRQTDVVGGSSYPPFNWRWTDGSPFTIFDEYYPPSAGGYAGCAFASGLNNCCSQDYDCLWMGNMIDGTLEPNNVRKTEYCVSMGHSKALSVASWNDINCNKTIPFVCKRPLIDGPYCTAPTTTTTTGTSTTSSSSTPAALSTTTVSTTSTSPSATQAATSTPLLSSSTSRTSTTTRTTTRASTTSSSSTSTGSTTTLATVSYTLPASTTTSDAGSLEQTASTTTLAADTTTSMAPPTTTVPCSTSFELVGYTGALTPSGPLRGVAYANRTADFLADLTRRERVADYSEAAFHLLCQCYCLETEGQCASVYIYRTTLTYFCVPLKATSILAPASHSIISWSYRRVL